MKNDTQAVASAPDLATIGSQPRLYGRMLVTLVVAAICFAATTDASAQLPRIRLHALYPAGAQRGTSAEVTVASGQDTEDVSALRFSHPGITAVQKMAPMGDDKTPKPVANTFVVTVAADAPSGIHDVRAVGRFGISNPRAFVVGTVPEVRESEANNDQATATEMPTGNVANGQIQAALDVDWYRFSAQAGERLSIACRGEAIDSQMDPVVELLDPAGKLIELNRDFVGRDAFISYDVPADGEYFVKVYDSQYRGGGDYFYRLTVTAAPWLDFVFPPVVQSGVDSTVAVVGWNLAGATVDEADGRRRAEVVLNPGAGDVSAVSQWTALTRPSASAVDTARLDQAAGESGIDTVAVDISSLPVEREVEPNDTAATAQAVEAPRELVGQFQTGGDRDWFSLQGKKGQVFWLEVFSERLGLPTDPALTVVKVTRDAEGKETTTDVVKEDDAKATVGGLSFPTATHDPTYRLACEDAEYRVMIRDLAHSDRGDVRLMYRLSIRAETPDFRLVAMSEYPINTAASPFVWTPLVRKGGTDKIRVLALRRDGFNGEIALSIAGLPESVKANPAVIGPGQNETYLVVSAATDAADWFGPVTISGRSMIGDTEVVRQARPAAVVWPGTDKIAARTRMSRELALAVRNDAAFVVEVGVETIDLSQSQLLKLPVKVTRRGDFKGEVTLTAAHRPPKVTPSPDTPVKVAADQTEATVNMFAAADAPAGRYTFYLQADTQIPFTKDASGKDKKPVAVADASTAVTVNVRPGPLTITAKLPDKGIIKKGTTVEIPVQLERRNEFTGPLRLSLEGNVAGLTVAAVEAAEADNQIVLKIEVAADAAEGERKDIAVSAHLTHGEREIDIQQPITLNVQP